MGLPLKSKDLFPSLFSRHASAYHKRVDEIMARGESRGRARLIDLLEASPGMKVLDLACGPGTLSRPLAQRVAPGGEVIGVDLAEGMIALARSAGIANARFVVMDIEALDFPDATFDAVACGHGLQFAPDLGRAMREARRVLRPGGRFAASVPVDGGTLRPWALVEQAVDRWLPPAPRASDNAATRATVNDPVTFRQAAYAAGFQAAQVELIEDSVHWNSAEQFVAQCMSWWDLAARMEGASPEKREGFRQDALATLREQYPGPLETVGRTHVLWATA